MPTKLEPKLNVAPIVTRPTAPAEVAAPMAVTTPKVEAFTNGKADAFTFQDKALTESLKQLHGDAATLEQVLPRQDPKVLIVGTARSKPVPGENGFLDYAWGERLGEELRKQKQSVGTGAGPGAMEAPLRGHARMDGLLDIEAKRSTIGWEAGEPTRQGANIILPHEQGASPFVQKDRLASMEKFLFRMEFLFRSTSDFVTTPGGYGTVAELFAFMAMKSHGHVGDPIVFGAPDDFFNKFNAAFEPFLNEREKPDLANIFTDPAKLAEHVAANGDHVPEEDLKVAVGRMVDTLEKGFHKLDGRPPAVAFFGGMGERSKAAAGIAGDIAKSLATKGANLRVGGSPVIDKAVLDAARSVNPKAELEAFAMEDAPVTNSDGLEYMRAKDVLVLRELMNSNLDGIVVAPEGAKQLGLLFTAACDIQTGEMPKGTPVIVIDPDGKFDEVKKMLKETMLSANRRYINPEDLDIFATVKTADEALAVLNKKRAEA